MGRRPNRPRPGPRGEIVPPPTPGVAPDLRGCRSAPRTDTEPRWERSGHTICRACGQTTDSVASWGGDGSRFPGDDPRHPARCTHSRRRRRLRRDVHGAAPPTEVEAAAEKRRRRDRGRHARAVHDVPALPARGGRRLDLTAPRGGPAPPRPEGLPDRHRRGRARRPRQADRDRHHPRHRRGRHRGPGDRVRRDRHRAGVRVTHPAHSRAGRIRHRFQDRRGGHRAAQPRHRTDGHRLRHP